MRLELEVIVWRGGIAESRHRIQAAVSDPEGRLEAATGDAGATTTFRSAAKPFQLLPLVERGHADRWGLTDEHLAVAAASHTGSPEHVALVRGILDRLGLDERSLACGYHEPLDPVSLEHPVGIASVIPHRITRRRPARDRRLDRNHEGREQQEQRESQCQGDRQRQGHLVRVRRHRHRLLSGPTQSRLSRCR